MSPFFFDLLSKNEGDIKSLWYNLTTPHSRIIYGYPVETSEPYYQKYMRANI